MLKIYSSHLYEFSCKIWEQMLNLLSLGFSIHKMISLNEIISKVSYNQKSDSQGCYFTRWLLIPGSDQIISVAQSCLTLFDPMNRSTPGLPVHHHLPESTQTHIHWVGDAIQSSHPLSSPSPPAPNPQSPNRKLSALDSNLIFSTVYWKGNIIINRLICLQQVNNHVSHFPYRVKTTF